MKTIGNSVPSIVLPLMADDGKAALTVSSSNDYSRPPREPVNVAIVDDDPHDRLFLERIIDRSNCLRAVGCYASGEAALKSPRIAEAEVVLMDIRMPGLSGTACTRLLKKVLPTLTVLMVTALAELDVLGESLLAGADGFLNKPLSEAQCGEAILFALAGGLPLAREVARKLAAPFSSCGGCSLNLKENAILECLARGMRNKEIADKLGVSIYEVQNRTRTIYLKLHVSNRAEAVSQRHSTSL